MRMFCRTALSIFAFITIAFGADFKPTPDEFLIPRLEVKVDGKLDEWSLDKTGYAIDPAQAGKDPAISLHISDPDNPIKGPSDLSARVGLAWDDKHLYIAATVTDDDLRGIKPGTACNVGPPGWKCDSVMFQIHSFRQAMKSNSPYTPSPNISLRYEVPAGGRGKLIDNNKNILDRADAYWKLPEGSTLATRETPKGYVVEAAIPWAALDYRPQAGEVSAPSCWATSTRARP
ncbi:MAG: hypothetical protein GXP25_23235 [Planctomycetes bacterium]|nr:hypothetical protein [Planctomycetota bacterium]